MTGTPARAGENTFVEVTPNSAQAGTRVNIRASCDNDNNRQAEVNSDAFGRVMLRPDNGFLTGAVTIPGNKAAGDYPVDLRCKNGSTASTTLTVLNMAQPSKGPATGGGGAAGGRRPAAAGRWAGARWRGCWWPAGDRVHAGWPAADVDREPAPIRFRGRRGSDPADLRTRRGDDPAAPDRDRRQRRPGRTRGPGGASRPGCCARASAGSRRAAGQAVSASVTTADPQARPAARRGGPAGPPPAGGSPLGQRAPGSRCW